MHIFCHKDTPYHFEDSDGWMAQHFFTGGTMPSFDLFAYMQTARLGLKRSWWINGNHYARTSEHWLERLSSNATRWTKQASDTALEGRAAPGKSEEGLKTYYRYICCPSHLRRRADFLVAASAPFSWPSQSL